MEREREQVQFPFPFPFLSFHSRVRYYRSGVRSLSVPVSVPGVCSFFLEQIWNRPVPVTVITVPVTVLARSSYRSGSVPGFCSGHLEQTRSCYRYYRSSYRSWHRSWSVPSPFLAPFLISSTFCSHTLRVRVWVWDPQMGADWCLWAQCIQEVPWGAQQAKMHPEVLMSRGQKQ